MRAAVYVRVSREEQLDNWSIAAQTREAEEYCRQKNWELLKIYTEEGISAHSDSIIKRPQFRKLLDDCKKGSFDIVVVHSIDRWSRNLGVTLESFKQLAENRVSFASISENIDYSTPEGRLFIAMLGAFAQYFSDNLAKHTRKGMKQRAVSGFSNGDVPFGYRRNEKDSDHVKNVYVVPDEGEAVKQIFQMYANGGHTLASLAAWLNEKGFKTRNKKELRDGSGNVVTGPQPFSLYSVRWILHNPFFTGKVYYKGQSYPGAHQAIIDEDLFQQVQARLKLSKNRSKTFSPSYRQYLLKGIVRCVYCGYPLWSETSAKGFTSYREPKNSRSHFACPANGRSISGRLLGDQIDNLIKSLVLLPSWRERVIDKLSILSERADMLRQREVIESKLRRLGKTFIDGLIEEGEYNVQRTLLQNVLNSMIIPEANAALKAGEQLENLGALWEVATLEEKHTLLSGMLEAVYVDLAASRSIVGIQPKAPFYPLFESLKNQANNKIIVFTAKPVDGSTTSTVMVETGESCSVRETRNIPIWVNYFKIKIC